MPLPIDFISKTRVVTEETITPTLAEKMLVNADSNRRAREAVVDDLARLLEQGKFVDAGSSIIFDRDGRMIDGQHRLKAIVKSGVPFRFIIVLGVDKKSQTYINSGIPNRLSDIFQFKGEKDAARLASTLSWVWRYESGYALKHQTNPPRDIAMELLEKHPEIRNSIQDVKTIGKFIHPAPAAFCHYLFHKKDPAMAREFFDKLKSGESLTKGDPILALRNAIINRSMTKKNVRNYHHLVMLVRAWNTMRRGKKITCMRFGESAFEGLIPQVA
jgi:hypothetical protein